MPRGKRRNPRLRGLLEKRIEKKTYMTAVFILLIAITIAGTGIVVKVQKDRIEFAKREEERIKALREIFVAKEEEEEQNEENENMPKDSYVTISVVGDILCEKPLYDDAYNLGTGDFNFLPMFRNVKKYTVDADLAIGTMETNFVDDTISGYRIYNSPKELGNALKIVGIDILSTAHNHSLDYGLGGIRATKNYFSRLGIDTIGTRDDLEEERVLIKEVNEVKIAFLSYTYGLNKQEQIRSEELEHVNLIEKEKIIEDIAKVRMQEVDYICVMMHWGDITSTKANEEQQELADFLLEYGVDLIVGSHPAVIEPMELRKNSEGKDAFISYSVGNYISASEYENSNIEMILEIKLKKSGKTGEVSLNKVSYTPVYLLDNGEEAENRYELYDIKDVIDKYEKGETEAVDEALYEKLKQALKDIEKLVGKEEN